MLKNDSISTSKAISLYCLVSLFLVFEMALQVSPSVMAFQLMHDLSIGTFALGIMSGCYFYTYAAMQVPSGRLLDRFNPRLIISVSLLICAISSLLIAVAPNLVVACLGRLLMGFGSAFAFVSVLTVVSDLFAEKYFATLAGITQMLAALGAMSGQLPVSLLVHHMGWRYSMALFSGLGFVLCVLVYTYLRYDRSAAQKAAQSAASAHPIKAVLSHPQTWWIGLYAFLLWAPMSGFTSLWGVPFLVKAYGLSHASAAFVCSLMWVGLALTSPIMGHYSTSCGNRKAFLYVSALAGFVSFGLVLWLHLPLFWLGVVLFIAGAACAGQALSFTVTKENHPSGVSSTVLGFNNLSVVASGAVFQPLIGWLLNHLNFNVGSDFKLALVSILVAYFLSFIVAMFFIKETLHGKKSTSLQ